MYHVSAYMLKYACSYICGHRVLAARSCVAAILFVFFSQVSLFCEVRTIESFQWLKTELPLPNCIF